VSRPLRPQWLLAADDGSAEYRTAAGLASIAGTGDVPDIAAYLHSEFWAGGTFAARLASVLHRRMMDGSRLGCNSNPTFGWVTVHPEDICGFVESSGEDTVIEDLLFGLVLINWSHECSKEVLGRVKVAWQKPVNECPVSRPWVLLKHLFLPHRLRPRGSQQEVTIRPESAIIPLLLGDRVPEACVIAQRRLKSSGLVPVKAEFDPTESGVRLAAALLIPVRGFQEISRLVVKDQQESQLI
jgi:CRISPR-associated protein Csx17